MAEDSIKTVLGFQTQMNFSTAFPSPCPLPFGERGKMSIGSISIGWLSIPQKLL
jgi:hypothetical protein